MEYLNAKIKRFSLDNTLWIYLVLLLFFSYLLLLSIIKDNGWNYLLIFGRLCLLYTPVLLFAYFRNYLKERLSINLQVGLWLISFIVWPLVILNYRFFIIEQLIDIEQYTHHLEITDEFPIGFLLTTNISILVTELALLFNQHLLKKISNTKWAQEYSVEQMLFGIMILYSLVLAVLGASEYYHSDGLFWATFKFILFSFQFILINMVYLFYFLINKHLLIPKILKSKGLIYYGFAIAGVILVFYPIFVFLIRYLPIVAELKILNYFPNTKIFSSSGGAGPFMVMILSVPIIVSNQWFQQNNQIAELEKQKSETELDLLKQQINPHFFFNTLNNLYALSITKDEQTPEVILQLSELMRYVIYKGKEDFVSLKEEVKYIEDYIELQQIRLHKKLNFTFVKNIKDQDYQIPPLLFITFVENAFKHGIEPSEGNCSMALELKSDEKGLVFSCKNSVEQTTSGVSGIGLENFKRRMELRYPQQHQIEIQPNADDFYARLSISKNHNK